MGSYLLGKQQAMPITGAFREIGEIANPVNDTIPHDCGYRTDLVFMFKQQTHDCDGLYISLRFFFIELVEHEHDFLGFRPAKAGFQQRVKFFHNAA